MSDDGVSKGALRLLERWVGAVQSAAIWVVAGAVALTVAAVFYSASQLGLNTSDTDMIAPETPFRVHHRAFQAAFPYFGDTLVVVIDGQIPEQADLAARALGRGLARDAASIDWVFDPVGGDFFRRNGLMYLDRAALAALADDLARAEPLLAALAADPTLRGLADLLTRALREGPAAGLDAGRLDRVLDRIARIAEAEGAGRPGDLSWRELVRAEAAPGGGRRRVLVLAPKLDNASMSPAGAALAEVRGAIAALGLDRQPGLTIRLTGDVALAQDELRSVVAGGKVAGLLSLVLVTLLLVLGLRSVRLVVATVASLGIGLALTAAFATAAVGYLNLISVTFAVLFVGLAVDFSIHLGLRVREARGHGLADAVAIRRAVVGVGPSLALSALCAAIGFLSFLPTDYQGFAELGLIAGGSMGIALAVNLTVLPAMLSLTGLKPGAAGGTPRAWLGLEAFIGRHHRSVRWGVALLAVAALAALPMVRFDFNPLNLKDPASESVAAFLDLAAEPGAAVYGIDVVVDDPATLGDRARALAALPEVASVRSILSFVPDDQDAKLEIVDDMALFLGPVLDPQPIAPAGEAETRAAVRELRRALADNDAAAGARRLRAALGALAPAGLDSLGHRLTRYLPAWIEDLGLALEAQPIGRDDLPADLRARWLAPTGQARLQALPAGPVIDNAAMRAFARAVTAVEPTATGTPVIVTAASDVVLGAFRTATLIALAAIVAVLALVLRRLADMALTLAPLALAALLTLAASVVLGLPFNFANVIVLPLIFGLGVASSVHLVLRRRQERRSGAAGRPLLTTSTPRAVLYSALTTIASFGSLAVSPHLGMASMGRLLTIAILLTLGTTLIVLPSLFPLLDRARRRPGRDTGL